MSLAITWTIEAHIPQLDMLEQTILILGDRLVAELHGIQDAINALTTQQAAGQEALSAHLTAIENEITQLDAETITQEQLDALASQVHAAAAVSAKGAEDLRAATERVKTMVPDAPAPPA